MILHLYVLVSRLAPFFINKHVVFLYPFAREGSKAPWSSMGEVGVSVFRSLDSASASPFFSPSLAE